jgi:membrane-bound metal-dependent hydrolase YbcI (DUF457 family)
MPLPIGHAAIGITIQSLCKRDPSTHDRWKALAGMLVLSNLPDVDVLAGIIVSGNGSAFHRGPTHSLIFALIAGLLIGVICKRWSRLPRLSFGVCIGVILSHLLADALLTSSPISFFWPITVNWIPGRCGLGEVVNLVLFGNHQDAMIIIGCALLVLAFRTISLLRIMISVRNRKALQRSA